MRVIFLAIFIFFGFTTYSQTVDPAFQGEVTVKSSINSIIYLDDGTSLAVGPFIRVNGVVKRGIVKFNADGTINNGFSSVVSEPGEVLDIQKTNDNKFIILGRFAKYNSQPVSNIVRINADGSRDETFTTTLSPANTTGGFHLASQADGKVLISGFMTNFNGQIINEDLFRVNANGTTDLSFDAPDFSSAINCIAVLPNGNIVIGGTFSSPSNYIAMLNSTGAIESGFSIGSGFNSWVEDLEVVSNNRILVGGRFSTYKGNSMKNLVALGGDGAVDATFLGNDQPNNVVLALARQSTGKILLAGYFDSMGAAAKNRIARLNTDGSLDNTFNIGTGPNGPLTHLSINLGDEILISGVVSLTQFNGQTRNALISLDGNGTLKTGGASMTIETHAWVNVIEKYGTDKLLITHSGSKVNGTPSNGLNRLNSDGTLDGTFTTPTFNAIPYSLKSIGTDILVGGDFTLCNGTSVGKMAKLNSSGVLDVAFNTNLGTGFNSTVSAFAIQGDGKILVGGFFSSVNGVNRAKLARLNSNGTIDNSFNSANGFVSSGYVDIQAIRIQSDGKILVGGEFTSFAGSNIKCLIRLNTDGTLDNTFLIGSGVYSSAGTSTVYGLEILSNGNLMVGGFFNKVDNSNANNLALLSANGTLINGYTALNFFAVEKIIQANDGSILVLERSRLRRLFPFGVLDNSFQQVNFVNRADDLVINGNQVTVVGSLSVAENVLVGGIARINLPAVPGAPTNLQGNVAQGNVIQLTWTDNATDEVGFVIERSPSNNLNFTTIATVTGTTYNDTDLLYSTQYYYRIKAFNTGGHSTSSNEINVTSSPPPPNAPTNLKIASMTNTGVVLSWTDNSNNETGFIVRRSTQPTSNFVSINTTAANATSFADEGLTQGTRYYYRITAVSFSGESAFVETNLYAGTIFMSNVNLSVCNDVAFTDPGGFNNYPINTITTTTLKSSVPGYALKLSFTSFQTDDLDDLFIYDGVDTNAPLIGLFKGNSLPPVLVSSNLDGALTLVFDSGPFDEGLSGWEAKATCMDAPKKPTDLNLVVVNKNQITVSWLDNASDETGFAIERSVNSGSTFQVLTVAQPGTTSFDDNTVQQNTTYYYRVSALKGQNFSAYTNVEAVAFGEGVWRSKSESTGLARTDAIAYTIGSKGYVGTGSANTPTTDFRAYSPTTNTWEQIASPTGLIRESAVAFAINDKAYVGTGEWFDPAKDLWMFDGNVTTWTQKADFGGTARLGAIGFSIQNKGYIGLGNDGSRKNDFWEYDPTPNTWTEKASFAGSARDGSVAFVIGNDAFVGTGRDASGKKKDFWKYSSANNTWTQIADFPGSARDEAVAFAIGDRGYVGTGSATGLTKDFWEYDPTSNTWRQVVSFGGSARESGVAFVINNKAYVGFGWDGVNGVNRRDLWEFTPFTVPNSPSAPTNLVATAQSSSAIQLSWADNSLNETSFILERSVSNTVNFQVIATLTANTTSYTDNGLSSSTIYYYRIKCVTDVGNSPYSIATSGTTLPNPPAAPTGLIASSVTYNSATLTWVDNANNENNYVIQISLNNGVDFNALDMVAANSQTYQVNGLNGATTYVFRLFALNTGGNSALSNAVTITTTNPPISTPLTLTASALSATSISLSWVDASTNEEGFRIERALASSGSSYTQLAAISPANSIQFTDNTVLENTAYKYRIRAYVGAIYSLYSNEVTVHTPLSPPIAPSNLVGQFNSEKTNVSLTWSDNSFNESEFKIERSVNGLDFTLLSSTTTPNYTDNSLPTENNFFYRVKAVNSGGESSYSNVASMVFTGLEGAVSSTIKLTVFPNPLIQGNDNISVEFESEIMGKVEFYVYDVIGKLILHYPSDKLEPSLKISLKIDEQAGAVLFLRVLQTGIDNTVRIIKYR